MRKQGKTLGRTLAVAFAVLASTVTLAGPVNAAEPVWQGPGVYHCPIETNGGRVGYSVNVGTTAVRYSTMGKPSQTYVFDAKFTYLDAQAEVNARCNPRPPAGF